jgi:flagellar M-ring protein FliF
MAETKSLSERWAGHGPAQQLTLAGVAAALIAALLIGAYFALRPSYQPLFTDLRPQDAATIVAELERQKIDFRLGDGGATIMVPAPQVHQARLKVMSRDLPLKGAVGFELFNNADLGLTEFAQKVNYQRALQGELARTIMSLSEIDSARVHLSLPEAGLFRRSGAKPRASVAITTRAGQDLPPDSVRGIQRLVAAAVPELEAHEVTIIDPRGAPMGAGKAGGDVVTDRRLELKIELERYYERKLLQQVETIVGSGNASVSVDATLVFDQVRISQESAGIAGGITRRLRPETGSNRPLDLPALAADAAMALEPGLPAERARNLPAFESGARRLEQIVAAPGNIRRLSVGVLVHAPLDAAAMDQIRQLIVATAGLSGDRGDTVAFFNRERFSAPTVLNNVGDRATPHIAGNTETSARERPDTASAMGPAPWLIGALLAVALAAVAWLAIRRSQVPRPSSIEQKQELLDRLRRTLAEGKLDATT